MLIKGIRVGRPSLILNHSFGISVHKVGGGAEALGIFFWSPAGKIHGGGQPSMDCGFCSGSDMCGGVLAQGEGCGWSMSLCVSV